MKQITIGSYSQRPRSDCSVNYDRVVTKVESGGTTTPPEFCIQLVGGGTSATIYAASEAAFEHLKKVVAADSGRITPGPEVLGIYLTTPPNGWPYEAIGRTTVRKAPDSIIASAAAAFPGKAPTRYPLRTTPGVEVISFKPRELIKFAPYDQEDSITVQNRNVTLRFATQASEMTAVRVITYDAARAIKLAASFIRKTPRRLIINSDVTGISLVFADGTGSDLGKVPVNTWETDLAGNPVRPE